MTPDARIFDRLIALLPTAAVVPWIVPRPDESIASYAHRLAESTVIHGDAIVCGVSFGGIIAQELAQQVNARACILVSSVRDVSQLPPWFRMFRPLATRCPVESALRTMGAAADAYPKSMGTDATARLTKLAGHQGAWHRWATASTLRWNPSCNTTKMRIVQIHGDRDTTFPIRYVRPDMVVVNGGHVLPLTHPNEIGRLPCGGRHLC